MISPESLEEQRQLQSVEPEDASLRITPVKIQTEQQRISFPRAAPMLWLPPRPVAAPLRRTDCG